MPGRGLEAGECASSRAVGSAYPLSRDENSVCLSVGLRDSVQPRWWLSTSTPGPIAILTVPQGGRDKAYVDAWTPPSCVPGYAWLVLSRMG
jgi:hypothetical protein